MNTYEKLIEIFTEVFGNEMELSKVTESSKLTDDLGINSIGMLYMAMAIESGFGIKFENGDFEKLITVADVIGVIDSKKKK